MSDPTIRGRSTELSVWQILMRHRVLLLPESLYFIVVSVGDIVLTYVLLVKTAHGEAPFRIEEGNPLARFILNHWGVQGLVYFKFFMVSIVTVIAQVVATKKPDAGRWILRFGTLVVGCVVIYSLILYRLAH